MVYKTNIPPFKSYKLEKEPITCIVSYYFTRKVGIWEYFYPNINMHVKD